MLILVLFLPTAVLAKSKLKTSVRYTQGDAGHGHLISLTGKMPTSFEMTYSVSQNADRDTAVFVVDGTRFDLKSPPFASVPQEGDEPESPADYDACNDIAQISADRTVYVSFIGDQSSTALATSQLYTGTHCDCPNGILHILLNALIRGLGIILIFFCSWILLRSLTQTPSSPSLIPESRPSSTESSATLLKEDNEPSVDPNAPNGIAAEGAEETPVLQESVKSEADSDTQSAAPSEPESDTDTDTDTPTSSPNGFPPPRPENPQPISPAPWSGTSSCAAQSSWPAPSNWPANNPMQSPRSAIYIPSSPTIVPAPWSPHTDVSNLNLNLNLNPNSFSSTAAAAATVLIPPERNLIPPPPPPQTVPNFNAVLGMPRPSKIETILQVYDFIFLIDDSGSMMGSSWSEARDSVNQLANWILDNGWDRDGITLRFLNSTRLFSFKDLNGISDKNKIHQLVNTVHPDGGTPTGRKCSEILNAHIDKLERARCTPEYATIKPLILVVITDGAPSDCYDYALSRVLTSASKRLADTHHHPNSMAIQFVQVGGDPRATQALKLLTQLDTNGMVDAITSNDLGSLSPDKLGQLMLGGVHPNVRAKRA